MPNLNKIDPLFYNGVRIQDVGKPIKCLVWTSNGFNIDNGNSQIIAKYPFINAFGLNTTHKQIFDLSEQQEVCYISSAQRVCLYMQNVHKIVKTTLPNNFGVDGSGVTVAIIDTGCKPHLDLVLGKNRIIKFVDFVNGKTFAYDDNGHGTFVCGVLCGKGVCSNGCCRGVAPNCSIIVLKALNSDGETQVFTILDAMQWIIDHKKQFNIKVVCMSFGSEPVLRYDPLAIGAEALWDNGIVVVCASGNDGPEKNSVKSPAISPKVLSVGSCTTDNQQNKSEFCSYGIYQGIIKPEVFAPGENIVSLDAFNGFYTSMSGTSVSTPIVAGVAALLLQKQPQLSPNEIKRILISQSSLNASKQNLIINAQNAINYLL